LGKERKHSIRIEDDLDKKILRLAKLHFDSNYSRCLRFLVEAGVLMINRLDKESIQLLLEQDDKS